MFFVIIIFNSFFILINTFIYVIGWDHPLLVPRLMDLYACIDYLNCWQLSAQTDKRTPCFVFFVYIYIIYISLNIYVLYAILIVM